MYRDEDVLLREIKRLFEVIFALDQGEVSEADVDRATRDAVGLDLRTIDALPPETLVGLLAGTDGPATQRRDALAKLLEALAPDDPSRQAKADALRGASA